MNQERLSRRDLLKIAGASAAVLAVPGQARADTSDHPTPTPEFGKYDWLRPTEVQVTDAPFTLAFNDFEGESLTVQERLNQSTFQFGIILREVLPDDRINFINGFVSLPRTPDDVLLATARAEPMGVPIKAYFPEAEIKQDNSDVEWVINNGIRYEFTENDQLIVINELTSATPMLDDNGTLVLRTATHLQPPELHPDFNNLSRPEQVYGMQIAQAMYDVLEMGVFTGFDYNLWETYKFNIDGSRLSNTWANPSSEKTGKGYISVLASPLLGTWSDKLGGYFGSSPFLVEPK